jgi:endo-1,4-beta-xylanase
MQKGFIKGIVIAVGGFVFLNCSGVAKLKTASEEPSLKESFKGDFFIGTAMNTAQIEEKIPGAAVLIPQQFNAVTPENIMKAEILHPEWNYRTSWWRMLKSTTL